MAPIHLQVRYRPIRIGWCVREGDLEEFRKAVRLTHTLWGGRFNPVIPLGDPELARQLVRAFRVDCLYCISQSSEGDKLLEEFKHLFWPSFHKELFVQGMRGQTNDATFLDIYHPVRHLYEDKIKDREHPTWNAAIFQWQPSDPLADVFSVTFGAYPTKNDIGIDYDAFFRKYLAAREIGLENNTPLPASAFKEFTPSVLTMFDLRPVDFDGGRDEPGIYYGQSGDFTDLVGFWNLRAGGIELFFYDPTYRARLIEMTQAYFAAVRAQPRDRGWPDLIAVWRKSREAEVDIREFGDNLLLCSLSKDIWGGMNIRPSLMGFEEKSVLGSESGNGRISATFELPPKPFFDDAASRWQKAVVSVHPLVRVQGAILRPPYLPQLNEYYGRECYFEYNAVRSERDGIGIVADITTTSLTVHALDVRTLVRKVFEVFGISAKPSPAGLVGFRLIDQMGGLQGCRVFKIGGVRELIRAYSPDQTFTRSGALTTIRQHDPVSGAVGFSAHERLYIEPRDRRPLKPEDAFSYLLKKGVFRVGLRLVCPSCELENWVNLDDARTISQCEFCGREFNITPQLRDRDWAYRRSGLFGRNDHQGGGIPVALTLQQIETALHGNILAFTTGTELEPITASIEKCETDFVLFTESLHKKIFQIAIGECKGNRQITADDAQKMGLVADALTRDEQCEAFIVFSKTGSFTAEEVERCKLAQHRYGQRVILLSERELEPYFMYERAHEEFEIQRSAISLEDMAEVTQNIYFDPKPKVRSTPTPGTSSAAPMAPAS
jgi:hypothetical protein